MCPRRGVYVTTHTGVCAHEEGSLCAHIEVYVPAKRGLCDHTYGCMCPQSGVAVCPHRGLGAHKEGSLCAHIEVYVPAKRGLCDHTYGCMCPQRGVAVCPHRGLCAHEEGSLCGHREVRFGKSELTFEKRRLNPPLVATGGPVVEISGPSRLRWEFGSGPVSPSTLLRVLQHHHADNRPQPCLGDDF